MSLRFSASCWMTIAACFAPMLACAQSIPSSRISTETLRREVTRTPAGADVPVEINKVGAKVVLQTSDAAVPVANPDVISQQVKQLPVQAVVKPGPAGSVRVEDVKLQATERWQQVPQAQRARFHALDTAQRKVEIAAEKALSPGSSDADFAELKKQVDDAEKQTVEAYLTLSDDQEAERAMLIEQHGEIRRVEKALYGYGRDDRYPPRTYQRIFTNSPGAFALHAKAEDKPRCSAVLISEQYALTNNHCILEEAPDELEAVFDYETDLDGHALPSKTFPVEALLLQEDQERANLDFVVLQLGRDADNALPGDVYPAQCLSLADVHRDDPLYVIGHPLGDPRTVHDNTFVYFPYRVTPLEHAELEMLVTQEFASVGADAAFAQGKVKEFEDSYKLRDADGTPYYEYVSERFGGQPTIGVDSDTYRGNSGSPVFSRRTHAVIGLLFDGQEDLSQPWIPGWRAHEAVLPITKIVERLDAVLPAWRSDPKACVQQQ